MRQDVDSQIHKLIVEQLQEHGWEAQIEPVVAGLRPDVIATSPAGDTFVIETKLEGPTMPTHVATLSQLATFRDVLAERSPDRHVRAVLVTSRRSTPRLDGLARQLELDVFQVVARDAAAVADAVVSRIAPTDQVGLPGTDST